MFGIAWWGAERGDFLVLVADIGFMSDLDAESLTDAGGQPVSFVGIMTQVDSVHSHILRIDLQEQDELLQLPGGGGGELGEDDIEMIQTTHTRTLPSLFQCRGSQEAAGQSPSSPQA